MKKTIGLLLCLCLVFTNVSFADQKQEIKIANYETIEEITPFSVTGSAYELSRLSFDTLFELDENSNKVDAIATNFRVNSEYTQYNMTIRDGITFHDGTVIDGAYLAEHFNKLMTYENAYTYSLRSVDTVSANGNDLQFNLKYANPNLLLEVLTFVPVFKEENGAFIGSGAFNLSTLGTTYEFKAVANYYGGVQTVEKITVETLSSVEECVQGVKDGEYVTVLPGVSDFVLDEENRDVVTVDGGGYAAYLLYLNHITIAEVDMRKAIALGIDYEGITNEVFNSNSLTGRIGYYRENIDFAKDDLALNTNVDEAKALISNSDGKKDLTLGAGSEIEVEIANSIQKDLQEIGLNVTIVEKTSQTDMVIDLSETYEMTIESTITKFFTSSENPYGYESQHDIISQYTGLVEGESRLNLLYSMQDALANEVPVITLCYPNNVTIVNESVYDYFIYKQGSGIVNKLSFMPNRHSLSDETKEYSGVEDIPYVSAFLIAGIIGVFVIIAVIRTKKMNGKSEGQNK